MQFYTRVSPVKSRYPEDSVINEPHDTTIFSVETRTPPEHPENYLVT